MPYISQKTIDEIKDRLDAVSIVGEYVRLERRGNNYWGLCPFHNEKTPSFSVQPDRKSYYCFGCNEGGGIIDFMMAMDQVSFPEALTALAKKLGIEIQYESSGGGAPLSKEEEALSRQKDALAELYKKAAGSFHYILMESAEGRQAKEYVLERGVSLEMIARFRIGYAPADRLWLHKFLLGKGYSKEFLGESDLFSKKYPEYAFLSDRLVFPINDRQGRTVAFGGRLLDGEGPKYINSPESPLYKKRETLFAIDLALGEIRKKREVVLAEGYMDVVALHQAGIVNAAAPLGTAFTDEQARLVRRWADKIKLVFDNDEAGQNAAVKGILTCKKNALSCTVAVPQDMKDPADILKSFGAEYLSNSLKESIMDADYLVAKSKRDFLNKLDDSQGMSKAIAFLRPFYENADSEVDKEAFYKKIADNFGLEPQTVLHDLKFGLVKQPAQNRKSGGRVSRTVRLSEELFLLAAVAVNCEKRPSLFDKLREALPKEEFENQDARNIYLALEENFRAGALNLGAILSYIDDEALRVFLIQKNAVPEFSERPDQLVADGIRGLRIKRLDLKSKKLVSLMKLAKNEGKSSLELVNEKMIIDSQLQELKGAR
ncbi:MAG: DNA primase [Spirochaetaceae bacterium]|jgi:DNA primase|nr:DNA primase [Spirochaetaceae bacterium]